MTTLIRELIDIPEQVYRGDFVLRLTEGVTHPRETLRDYVVTEQLARCLARPMPITRLDLTAPLHHCLHWETPRCARDDGDALS